MFPRCTRPSAGRVQRCTQYCRDSGKASVKLLVRVIYINLKLGAYYFSVAL